MSVITFASLKGGVGKTSTSVNISAAFAHMGFSTLLIDLDPSSHASRLFSISESTSENCKKAFPKHSPLAKFFLAKEKISGENNNPAIFNAQLDDEPFVIPVRKNLELLPATTDLKYFIPAHGARIFSKKFPALIRDLQSHFEHIVIDTPPDFNILTRCSIASSDLVLSPIDPSEMGIRSAEELLDNAKHLKKPLWGFLRTMINSRAKRSHVLSNTRIGANLFVRDDNTNDNSMPLHYEGQPITSDPLTTDGLNKILGMANDWQKSNGINQESASPDADNKRAVHLLENVTYRTESQNQLTYWGKTAFDLKHTFSLSRQYLAIAREIEEILAGAEEDQDVHEAIEDDADFSRTASQV